jgi:hypothetical protein
MTEPTRAASRLIPGAQLMELLDLPIFGFIVAPGRVAQAMRDFLDADSESIRPTGRWLNRV